MAWSETGGLPGCRDLPFTPMPPKQEFPPLLAPGFHPMTLAEVRAKCVDGFPLSKTRDRIMAGLEEALGWLVKAEMAATVWLDGSFMTVKIDPEDVDFVAFVRHTIMEDQTPQQNNVILCLEADELWQSHHCDAYIATEYPRGHPLHEGHTADAVRYWRKRFGESRGGEPKGIATVTLAGKGGAP